MQKENCKYIGGATCIADWLVWGWNENDCAVLRWSYWLRCQLGF